MCCGDCQPIRCSAVPNTDWSGYTWLWESPEAAAFHFDATYNNGGPEPETFEYSRKIESVNRDMVHPGECPCLWLVPIRETLRNLFNGGQWQAPCIGSLQRVGQGWALTISRWHWATGSAWWIDNRFADWNFDDAFSGDCSYRWGGYAGWTPFGYWGYGWAYGWGYGWGAYEGNYAFRASYLLEGSKLLTDGTVNKFVLNGFSNSGDSAPEDWANPIYWPAFVNLTTIPKDGRQT